ncbi:MAG: hypothetical protein ACFFD2_17520 [Promethearchaeota archaeon]
MKPIIISVHGSGENRGTRIYFNSKDLRRIRKQFGDDFFLFTNKKLLAYIDPTNEAIKITTLESNKIPQPSIPTQVINNYENIEEELTFTEKIDDDFDFDIEGIRLDFYIPIQGTGDRYWIAEVCLKDYLGYYCVSTSLSNLKKQIQRKGEKHFPGLMHSKNISIKYVNSNLVHSPVPEFTARNAFDKIQCKKINDVEIPAHISIPNDAELTPIVDMGKGSIKNLKIRKREILAKYEITIIASKYSTVQNSTIKDIDDEFFWCVSTNKGELLFNPINGIKIEENNPINGEKIEEINAIKVN